MKHIVFVYGTLKRGYGNNRLLIGSNFVTEATTKEKYPLVVHGIPFLNDVPGKGHRVSGEIWEVNDLTLFKLDQLEGHGRGFYERRKITVVRDDTQEEINAWVYFICRKNYRGEKLYASYEDGFQQRYAHA